MQLHNYIQKNFDSLAEFSREFNLTDDGVFSLLQTKFEGFEFGGGEITNNLKPIKIQPVIMYGNKQIKRLRNEQYTRRDNTKTPK